MASDLPFTTISPAPPPSGFFPEDISLYKLPPSLCTLELDTGLSLAKSGSTSDRIKCTPKELVAARESSILRACAPILPPKIPTTDDVLILSWFRALINRQQIATQLADIQLDCEMLERDVIEGLGEETVRKILNTTYGPGDICCAKDEPMLSISRITYESVGELGA